MCCYLILTTTTTTNWSRRGVAASARIILITTLPNRRNPKNSNRFLSRLSSSLRNPNNHFCRRRITTSSSSITQQKGISHHRQKEAAGLSSSVAAAGFSTTRAVNSMMNSNGRDRILLHHKNFALSPSSVLKIQKGDITKWFVDDGSSDAIVNAANERMLGGGGVDGAIHRAAGTELRSACYAVQEVRPGVRCPKGDARITPAFRLPVSHIIHTVGPIYDDDDHPEVTLGSAYRNCLRLCKENNIQYVAFPAISCGVYGYPYDEAASVAISTVKEFGGDLKEVHFVLFEDAVFDAWLEKANELL